MAFASNLYECSSAFALNDRPLWVGTVSPEDGKRSMAFTRRVAEPLRPQYTGQQSLAASLALRIQQQLSGTQRELAWSHPSSTIAAKPLSPTRRLLECNALAGRKEDAPNCMQSKTHLQKYPGQLLNTEHGAASACLLALFLYTSHAK